MDCSAHRLLLLLLLLFISPADYRPCPFHLPLFDYCNNNSSIMKILGFFFALYSFLLLGPDIPLNALFLNAPSLCSARVRDNVSQPCKTKGIIRIVLYIIIFRFFNR
jgi:hypothetical protein